MQLVTNSLSRILYVSSVNDTVTEADLQKILATSRKNNQLNAITGVMCVAQMHFLQILEGPENNLIKLYSKIIDDRRHHDCMLLGIYPIEERTFKDWSMGYIKNPDAKISLDRSEILKYRDRDQADELVKIMRHLISLLK